MFSRLGLLLAAGLLASACASTRAATPVERPALDVPPAPPRIVEAAPAPDLGAPEPVPDLPPEKPLPAASAKARPSGPRDNREAQKTEVKPPDPVPPVAEAPVSPPQQAAPPLIRTPATADAAASERQIRETMRKAQAGLDNVDFKRSSGQRKNAYNEAKSFLERADAEIKKSNFELAKELAGKAEKLANELQVR